MGNPILYKKVMAKIDELCNEQLDSSEFKDFFSLPFTLPRLRFYAPQILFYTLNRREVWSYVQAKAPLDVKKAIWKHEGDELVSDDKHGLSHYEIRLEECRRLGVSKEELEGAKPTPLARACYLAWLHIAAFSPWLEAFGSSAVLERRSNNSVVKGGGFSKRLADKIIKDTGVKSDDIPCTMLHREAETPPYGHNDMLWEAVIPYIKTEEDCTILLRGVTSSLEIDRAHRSALTMGMKILP